MASIDGFEQGLVKCRQNKFQAPSGQDHMRNAFSVFKAFDPFPNGGIHAQGRTADHGVPAGDSRHITLQDPGRASQVC